MKKTIYSLFALLLVSTNAYGAASGINPTSLKLAVYKVAVSTSGLCTNPITVFETSTPTYENVFDGPTLASGTLADGTYPCVMIEFSSIIKPISSETSDNSGCTAALEYEQDVCSSGSYTLIDGTTGTCASGDTRVAMYLSTFSTEASGSDAFNPPLSESDSTYGFNLAAALTVSGTASGTFVANGNGKVEERDEGGGNWVCDMQPPLFSFR